MAKKLTEKQELFCREYLIDFNATKAAERAGYSKSSAFQQGYRLLKDVEIQSRIGELSKRVLDNADVTVQRIVAELSKIAFANVTDYVDEDGDIRSFEEVEVPEAIASVIRRHNVKTGETTKTVKLHDKLRALELLGKYLAMFTERVDHTTGGEALPTQTTVIHINHRKPGESLKEATA